MSKSKKTNAGGSAAPTCANKHSANDKGQCSVSWCAFNKWPKTWPENRSR